MMEVFYPYGDTLDSNLQRAEKRVGGRRADGEGWGGLCSDP